MHITVFQELQSLEDRSAMVGFGTEEDRPPVTGPA